MILILCYILCEVIICMKKVLNRMISITVDDVVKSVEHSFALLKDRSLDNLWYMELSVFDLFRSGCIDVPSAFISDLDSAFSELDNKLFFGGKKSE